MKKVLVLAAMVSILTLTAQADPTFYATSTPSAWTVAVNHGADSSLVGSFQTASFGPAWAIIGRTDWIAMNDAGWSGGVGNWTYMVFRQTFDLTGYDPTTANLQFQWAADDSGQGFADRGSWTPKFSLNGGAFNPYPGSPTDTYSYSPTITLTGFVNGLNTIDFYVEGNGQTDGFALRTVSFTATPSTNSPVPEPATVFLAASGLLAVKAFRRKSDGA